MLSSVILSNGMLDESKLYKREKIYQGMNGKYIERFYLSENDSYIFKPLTNEAQQGKEAWVQENILGDFPDFYPKILAKSNSERAEDSWLILEDLGNLQHEDSEDIVKEVTKWMSWWHQYPSQKLFHESLQGQKPSIDHMIAEIVLKKERVFEVVKEMDVEPTMIEMVYQILLNQKFLEDLVFSHGDLHLGNYVKVGERICILDWEHAHLNLPYWDLYHLLELSHPLFPKTITREYRQQMLDYYCELRCDSLTLEAVDFKKEYYIFATAFSIWMLLLIQADLQDKNGKWTVEQLERELDETKLSLTQCVAELIE